MKQKREHIFRAWDKHSNKMLYNKFILAPTTPDWSPHTMDNELREEIQKLYKKKFKGDPIASYVVPSVIDWSNYYGIDNLEIMQYVGLKDKNDKRIFEGDIVKFKDFTSDKFILNQEAEIAVVEWYNAGFVPRDFETNHKGGRYIHFWDMLEDIEVIGNIYENPELISK